MLSSQQGRHAALLGASLAIGIFSGAHADSAAIYVSYDKEGSPRFSSQAYDQTYVMFLNAERQAPATRSSKAFQPINRRTSLWRAAIEPIILRVAQKHHLEPALLRSVIEAESGFDRHAVSPKGAIGLMQVLPETGSRYGITQLHDPAQNLEAGARHLRELLAQFDANLPLALAAYNAGEGAVTRHARRIPPYRETMLYVPTVLTSYATYRQADSISHSPNGNEP